MSVAGCAERRCSLPDERSPENEPGDGFPAITLEADTSSKDGLELSVGLVRHFDENGPARMDITVLNDSSTTRTFTFHMMEPFPPTSALDETGDSGLSLDPVGRLDSQIDRPDAPENGCWRLQERGHAIADIEAVVELSGCETLTQEYDVFQFGDECPTEGRYRFETTDMGEQGHAWGFTLILS